MHSTSKLLCVWGGLISIGIVKQVVDIVFISGNFFCVWLSICFDDVPFCLVRFSIKYYEWEKSVYDFGVDILFLI